MWTDLDFLTRCLRASWVACCRTEDSWPLTMGLRIQGSAKLDGKVDNFLSVTSTPSFPSVVNVPRSSWPPMFQNQAASPGCPCCRVGGGWEGLSACMWWKHHVCAFCNVMLVSFQCPVWTLSCGGFGQEHSGVNPHLIGCWLWAEQKRLHYSSCHLCYKPRGQ